MQKNLDEIIRMYAASKESVKLVVINVFDNSTGNIWLAKGKVTHATIEEVSMPRTGLGAFHKILSWKDCKIYVLDNCNSREITIERTLEELKIPDSSNSFTKTTSTEDLFGASGIARKSSITSIDVGLVKTIEKLNDLNVLEGFVGAAIIDNKGHVYHSNIKKGYLTFNAACNFAYQSFKMQENMLVNMNDKPLKIMILESPDKIHTVYRFQDKYILYIVLDKPEANLGLARSIINNLL